MLTEQGHLEWQFLECKKSTQSLERDAHTRSFLHHRHQERLNALDDTEALLYEIAKSINWGVGEIPPQPKSESAVNQLIKKSIGKLADKWRNPSFVSCYQGLLEVAQDSRQAKIQQLELDQFSQSVLLQFLLWDEPNPNAFYANKLPLVFLPTKLKKAIRNSDKPLGCSHALAISRTESQYHQDLIEQCTANNWSLKELKEAIKTLPTKSNTSKAKPKKTQKISFREQKTFLGKITQDAIAKVKPEQAQTLAVKYQELADLYKARAQES